MLLYRIGSNVPVAVLPTLDSNGITLDPTTRAVTLTGQEPQRLTPLEFRLLYILMTNPDQVLPVDVIVERVWGYNDEGNRELVRGLVRRLRRKIEPNPDTPRLIFNLPGVGYRFSSE
jgi:DNA-binding response OmpR family regulator